MRCLVSIQYLRLSVSRNAQEGYALEIGWSTRVGHAESWKISRLCGSPEQLVFVSGCAISEDSALVLMIIEKSIRYKMLRPCRRTQIRCVGRGFRYCHQSFAICIIHSASTSLCAIVTRFDPSLDAACVRREGHTNSRAVEEHLSRGCQTSERQQILQDPTA